MEQKKKVYVETSVVGYLTARPSHDVIKMARQHEEDPDYLEELWRIKDEIASRFASFQEYCDDLMRYQRETHPEWYKDDSSSSKNEPVPVVAEDPVDYHAKPRPDIDAKTHHYPSFLE